jgi:hypothetical protein
MFSFCKKPEAKEASRVVDVGGCSIAKKPISSGMRRAA